MAATEAGWSQAELAIRVGTDGARVSRYEAGRITPSADALVRLGDRLAAITQLGDDELATLNSVIDGLLAKTRLAPSPPTSADDRRRARRGRRRRRARPRLSRRRADTPGLFGPIAVLIGRDAKRHGRNGWAWGLLFLWQPVIVGITYLIVRNRTTSRAATS